MNHKVNYKGNHNIAVLASGKGSNLKAILQAVERGDCCAKVEVVICNKADAGALQIAKNAGVPHVYFINPKDYTTRVAFDAACTHVIEEADCKWVVLAGYMRILSEEFIQGFPQRIINIHPSLLPAFIGADAVGDALRYGVKVSGCTVHIVTKELDSGPILAQSCVPVLLEDDYSSLHARIQEKEYEIYPAVIDKLIKQG